MLDNALPEFPSLDVSVFFSESDRVESGIADASEYSVRFREPQELCDRCLADLVREVMLSGGLTIASALRAELRKHHLEA